jgi:hypothetical protein
MKVDECNEIGFVYDGRNAATNIGNMLSKQLYDQPSIRPLTPLLIVPALS